MSKPLHPWSPGSGDRRSPSSMPQTRPAPWPGRRLPPQARQRFLPPPAKERRSVRAREGGRRGEAGRRGGGYGETGATAWMSSEACTCARGSRWSTWWMGGRAWWHGGKRERREDGKTGRRGDGESGRRRDGETAAGGPRGAWMAWQWLWHSWAEGRARSGDQGNRGGLRGPRPARGGWRCGSRLRPTLGAGHKFKFGTYPV